MERTAHSYPDDYFQHRHGNDPLRQKSFDLEANWLRDYVGFEGTVCDVGCSTGEFLERIGWVGPRYGMEVSEHAIHEAESRGVRFDASILTETLFFDFVVFRGTIQHLISPFEYISATANALRHGGHVAFLMTPNADSLYYRFHRTLPALEDDRNFFIPSETVLTNVLRNAGLEVVAVEAPYWGSPYANPVKDFASFGVSLLTRKPRRHAFPGNMINLLARKEDVSPTN